MYFSKRIWNWNKQAPWKTTNWYILLIFSLYCLISPFQSVVGRVTSYPYLREVSWVFLDKRVTIAHRICLIGCIAGKISLCSFVCYAWEIVYLLTEIPCAYKKESRNHTYDVLSAYAKPSPIDLNACFACKWLPKGKQ